MLCDAVALSINVVGPPHGLGGAHATGVGCDTVEVFLHLVQDLSLACSSAHQSQTSNQAQNLLQLGKVQTKVQNLVYLRDFESHKPRLARTLQ